MRRALGAERGTVSVELLGVLPYLLLAALMAWQILLITSTVTSASNAARSGSRTEGRGGDGEKAAIRALSPGLRDGAKVKVEDERAAVRVRVPIVFPGLSTDAFTVRRTAELPAD